MTHLQFWLIYYPVIGILIFFVSVQHIHKMKRIKHKATPIFYSVLWPIAFPLLGLYVIALCIQTLAILAPVYFKYQYMLFRHNWKKLK